MAYCSQCGNQVRESDLFCARCGGRQPAGHSRGGTAFLEGVPPRTATVLCYVPWLGWIAAIVVLAAARFRDDLVVRFHAFQGLYLFVLYLIVDRVVSPFFHMVDFAFPVGTMLRLAVLGIAIFMMVKAGHDERYSLPIVGELAERSIAER